MEAVRHEASSECEMEVGERGASEEEEEVKTVEEGRAEVTGNEYTRLESEQINKALGGLREPLEPLADTAGEEAAYSALGPLAQQLQLLTGSWQEFDYRTHLKGCKWAPDGTCLLVCSSDNKMRVYNLPPELYCGPVDTQLLEMRPVLTHPLGEVIYDYCWYPIMSSWQPDTACFATTCKDHPVQLWDAFDLQKRASYTPHNHLDELVTPHSLAFSLNGQRLFCGFNKCVRVFDTARPGQQCQLLPTHEKQWGGQNGIVSCIAMHPTELSTFAAGSYSCQVGVYSDGMRGPLFLLTGVGGGVTHMLFSTDGNCLYTGFRKCSVIKVWDLRNPGNLLGQVDREVITNQKVYFDFYRSRYLLSGTTSGYVKGWDLETMGGTMAPSDHLLHLAHSDPVTGCSVHPSLPLLATASGQRHYILPCSSSDSDEDTQPDNSLKLWSLTTPTPLSPPSSPPHSSTLPSSTCISSPTATPYTLPPPTLPPPSASPTLPHSPTSFPAPLSPAPISLSPTPPPPPAPISLSPTPPPPPAPPAPISLSPTPPPPPAPISLSPTPPPPPAPISLSPTPPPASAPISFSSTPPPPPAPISLSPTPPPAPISLPPTPPPAPISLPPTPPPAPISLPPTPPPAPGQGTSPALP